MEYDEQYVLLNFKEKIEQKFFTKSSLFFKMVNLDTKEPFVQIGSHVFNGKYEDATFGTNLFFEEQDQPRVPDAFDQETPVNLKYIAKTAKVLTLRWQKVPDEIINVDTRELIELEFLENYDAVLNKIENGTLDIRDVIRKSKTESPKKRQLKHESIEQQMMQTESMEMEFEEKMIEEINENPQVEKSRYNLLRELVEKPAAKPEYYNQNNLDNFTTDQEFSILKELYQRNLDYNAISLRIDENNIQNYVDIEASIKDGVIGKKDINRLTDHEKQLLISLNNFDNLSIPMKLTVLVEHLKEEKKLLAELSDEKLKEKDKYGRTPKHRYRLLKSLAKDIQYYMFLRIRENNMNAKCSEK